MAREGETHRLISSEKVEGTSVVNAKGEDLGTIEEVMIDKISGQVAYAVLKYGSVLGDGRQTICFAVGRSKLRYALSSVRRQHTRRAAKERAEFRQDHAAGHD
jgi:sporulation protein YlmC with PRC-barrel domain